MTTLDAERGPENRTSDAPTPAVKIGDRITWRTCKGQMLGAAAVEDIRPGLDGERWLRVSTDSVLGQWLPASEITHVNGVRIRWGSQ